MTTTNLLSISDSALDLVTGGAGVQAGTFCTPDNRNIWQRYAPTAIGGKPNPTCTNGVLFDKRAIQGEPGERSLTPDALHEAGNAFGKL